MSHKHKLVPKPKADRKLEITLPPSGQLRIKPLAPFTVAELQTIASGIMKYAGGITIAPKAEPVNEK